MPTKYVDSEAIQRLFYFEKDMRADNVEVSTLDSPKILDYYLEGWSHWN